jgi:hypothetical protein
VKPANLVELGAYARQADPFFPYARNIVSLAKMVERYCDGKVLEKGPVRTGNWEMTPLSEAQKFCACPDRMRTFSSQRSSGVDRQKQMRRTTCTRA